MKDWQYSVKQARFSFHKDLEEVLKSHLECSPSFLIHLEMEIRLLGKYAKSVSWDPARMVGWKILTAGIELAAIDITTLLKEMIPKFNNEVNGDNYDNSALVNGSLFTDYVHYISMSNSNLSPRNATKILLEKLLRTTEINDILKNYSSINLFNKTLSEQVETLLVEFGWPAKNNQNENKLAECIQEMNGNIVLNTKFTGNDIRIICESYCKDLVDTLCSKIGYSEKELWNLLALNYPEYQSQNQGWNYEISKMTIGSAIFILSALLNEAFPDKKYSSDNLIKNLRELSRKLNPLSHHPHIEIDTFSLSDEIFNILNLTNDLVTEMPWHFYPIQRYGHQPYILTGNAWSHSYRQNRQLSIILWTGVNDSESMLVWNPSKANPVIPDGILINRP